MSKPEELQSAFIPRNYIEHGTFMGGIFKIRNAIEGGAIAAVITALVVHLPFSLTTRIIILCITTLPAAMLCLIGINGESVTSFLLSALWFLGRRRMIYRYDTLPDSIRQKRMKLPRRIREHQTPKKKSNRRENESKSAPPKEFHPTRPDNYGVWDIRKKRKEYDTSTKRGIRKQAREDIHILKKVQKQELKNKRFIQKEMKQHSKELKRARKKEQKAEQSVHEVKETSSKEGQRKSTSITKQKLKRKYQTIEEFLPIQDSFPVRLFTCIHLYLEGKINCKDFGRYLQKEKFTPLEKTIIELAHTVPLSTAELVTCLDKGLSIQSTEDVLDKLYCDETETYETLAEHAQINHTQYPVLQAIGNLYLNKPKLLKLERKSLCQNPYYPSWLPKGQSAFSVYYLGAAMAFTQKTG